MEERVKKVLEGLKPGIESNYDKNFIEDGVLDSLDIMNLIVKLEEAFDIEIDPEDVITDNFETVEAIEALIKKC